MSIKRRIVTYQAGRWSRDEELLAAIEEASGLDRKTAASQLAKRGSVFLSDLQPEAAEGLQGLLDARQIDYDVEPASPAADKVEWLTAEIPKWVKRGFISPYSLPGIYQNYGLQAPAAATVRPGKASKERDPGFLVRAVLSIGAVLIGLGLILFIASNWQKIPPEAKIGGALALTLAALHGGYRLRFVYGPYPKIAACLFTISLFGIGGVVTLIAQTYHLLADTFLLPLVWGALCLPVGLLLRFKPALYLASALWLWSYWLYPAAHGHLPWYYAALLLGFLLPFSIAVKDKLLYYTHIAVLMLALVSTLGTGDFWLCSAWVAGLVVLRFRDPEPVLDWLTLAGFLAWHVVFLLKFDDLPNVFFLVPLAFFFHLAHRKKANGLMLATIATALLWLVSFLFQLTERFDLPAVSPTGFVLWLLAIGIVLFGAGRWLRRAEPWRLLTVFLRFCGAGLAAVMVYAMSFRFYQSESAFFESPLLLGTSLLACGLGFALSILRPADGGRGEGARDEGGRQGRIILLGLVALGFALAVTLPPSLPLHVVLFNLILFLGALFLMLQGQRERSLLWYNLGITLFVILIASRYFDTFVDLLPRSVFFVLGGVFLIVWAILVDRQRKRPVAAGGQDV